MKIALSGWFWNRPDTGSGQYLRHLLEALAQQYPETQFILIAPPDHLRGQPIVPGVQLLPAGALPGPIGKVWWEQITLPMMAQRAEAEVLHIPYWAPPFRTSIPTVVTVHDLIPLLLPAYRGNRAVRLYTRLVSAAAPRASLLITDSEASRSDIITHLHVPERRVRAIPLAADASYTASEGPDDAKILEALGLEPGYILYLGGFDNRKNLPAILGAFSKVHEVLNERARLVIAGALPAQDTAFSPDPRRLMHEAGLSPSAVRLVGFIPEGHKATLYRGARVFTFPSRYEGFGLPALEALACGTPVVGSCAASLPEVVGDAGVLVNPDDVEGMAAALIQILTDETYYQALCTIATKQASRFSWEATAASTFAIYREVRPPKPD